MTFNHRRKLRLRFDEYVSRKEVALSTRRQLILDHRCIAFRMTNALFRRWSIRLSKEDRTSIADLGLCEAAMRFRIDKGTQFTSYLFFYIKSEVIKTIRMLSNKFDFLSRASLLTLIETQAAYVRSSGSRSCPETIFSHQQLQKEYKHAFTKLSKLESVVIQEIYLNQSPVAHVAKLLGYSRGHISEVKHQALRKLREALLAFQ